MKIAIMTIQSVNYGNRLQNWALQTVLEEMGHEAASLRRSADLKGSARSKLRFIKQRLGMIKHLRDRVSKFREFNRRIVFSDLTVSREYVSPGVTDAYDVLIMGSDQIWNPDFGFNSDLEYLPFVPSSQKIAYAASFGVSRIDDGRTLIASFLRDIPSISVREDAGAAIVEDLINVNVEVVLDPAMLINVDDWLSVAREPSMGVASSPFLLKYVLGNDAYESVMDDFARKRGLVVVDLKDTSLPVGPAEFVWLTANASMVCTDSFHASVFSLLFHRPFVIFERQSADADMSSRFDTLCRIFGMEHHRYCKKGFDLARCENEDWGSFESRLAAERVRSLAWLDTALAKVGDVSA